MKTLTIVSSAVLSALMFTSCSQSVQEMKDEIDSLTAKLELQESQLQSTNTFIDLMNVSMDSVVMADGLFIIGADQEGVPSNAAKMKANIDAYGEMLKNQRQRIEELEQQIVDNEDAASKKMKAMIAKMKAQIDAKDAEIAKLKEEIANNRLNIEELERRNTALTHDVANLSEQNRAQQSEINRVTAKLNSGYYIIGTKKELKAMGLVSGGSIFKKAKLELEDVNVYNFNKINIIKTTSIQVPGKSPKILTAAPKDSYSFQDNGNGTTTLVIQDTNRFWSLSNFLVIQY